MTKEQAIEMIEELINRFGKNFDGQDFLEILEEMEDRAVTASDAYEEWLEKENEDGA